MMLRPALLVLVLSLAACGVTDTMKRFVTGGEDNAEPPAPLVTFRAGLNVVELWSRKTGIGTDEQYLKLSPVIAGQRLFITDTDGRVQAMDATNGNVLWTRNTRVRITGGPGYGENLVFVGTAEGEVLAFLANSGKDAWQSRVSSEILSPPMRSEDVTVVRTNDGKIYGLDGSSGKRLWTYDRTVPTLTLRGTGAPVIRNGAAIAGFDGGRLAAVELKTGRLLWESSIAAGTGRSELDRMVDIDSTPVIVDGVIYVVTFQGYVAALQMDSGRILWSREVSSYAGFSVDNSQVFVTDENSHVMALDRFSGSTNWINEKLHARGVSGPESVGDYIVAGDFEGYLHWMDKTTGEFVARTRLSKSRILVQPVAIGKVLYAFSSDGTVAAYTFR